MEHPLITDADTLSIDELQSRINDLSRKLGIAHRMQNAGLRHQIQMALETYQTQLQKKQQELLSKTSGNTGSDYTDRIDIS